jgi:hypothetical protein
MAANAGNAAHTTNLNWRPLQCASLRDMYPWQAETPNLMHLHACTKGIYQIVRQLILLFSTSECHELSLKLL